MLSHDVPAKAFSLPVRTMALVLSSLSKFCSASFNSINKAVDRALSALGRFRVTDTQLVCQQTALMVPSETGIGIGISVGIAY